MQVKTILVTKNNVTPIQQICLSITDTDITPSTDTVSNIDYASLNASEKTKFDDLMTILESKAV